MEAAVQRLLANLDELDMPLPLLSRFLPDQFRRVRRGELAPAPRDLVIDRVADTLRDYRFACTANV